MIRVTVYKKKKKRKPWKTPTELPRRTKKNMTEIYTHTTYDSSVRNNTCVIKAAGKIKTTATDTLNANTRKNSHFSACGLACKSIPTSPRHFSSIYYFSLSRWRKIFLSTADSTYQDATSSCEWWRGWTVSRRMQQTRWVDQEAEEINSVEPRGRHTCDKPPADNRRDRRPDQTPFLLIHM